MGWCLPALLVVLLVGAVVSVGGVNLCAQFVPAPRGALDLGGQATAGVCSAVQGTVGGLFQALVRVAGG